MATISAQENQYVISKLQCLKEKFVAMKQENQCMLGDLQQITIEKQQQHEVLTLQVQQFEATIVSLQQQGTSTQGILKEPKISLPMKFDGIRSLF